MRGPTVATPGAEARPSDPDAAAAWRDIASGRPQKAVERLRRLAKSATSSTSTTEDQAAALAQALVDLDQREQAVRALQAALKTLGPRRRLNETLFELLYDAGRFDELEAAFAALANGPVSTRILCLYAEHRRFDVPDALRDRISAVADAAQSDVDERRHALATLSAIEDRRGAHADGFAALDRLAASYPRPRAVVWARQIEPSDGAPIATAPLSASASKGPRPSAIFIVGLPRSGSTLLAQVLDAHPRAMSVGESLILPSELQTAIAELASGDPTGLSIGDANQRIDAAGLKRLRSRFLAASAKRRAGAARRTIVDKTLTNHRHVAFIARALPDAVILHALRDPRAQLFSIHSRAFNVAHAYKHSLATLGRAYGDYLDVMARWDDAFPGRVVHVDHDRFKADVERGVRTLLDAVGLPFDAACLQPERASAAIQTSSAVQARQPIGAAGDGRWSVHAERMEPAFEPLGGVDAARQRYEDIRRISIV